MSLVPTCFTHLNARTIKFAVDPFPAKEVL